MPRAREISNVLPFVRLLTIRPLRVDDLANPVRPGMEQQFSKHPLLSGLRIRDLLKFQQDIELFFEL